MHVKKGDNVIVLSGKDKGKSGKIARAFPKQNLVVVEGINLKTKHQRRRSENQKGQIVEMPAPIHASNVRRSDAPAKKESTKKSPAKKAAKK